MINKRIAFSIAALIFLLFSCAEKKTDCLAPDATNFAVDADKNCDSCCTFPKLTIFTAAIWGDESTLFSYQNVYEDSQGQPFFIDTIAFYCSGFELKRADGTTTKIQDSVQIRVFPDSSYRFFSQEIALIRPTNSDNRLGELIVSGDYDSLRFFIGLSEIQQKVIPLKAPANHPLRPQKDSLWRGPDNGFIFLKIRRKKDTAAAAPLSILETPVGQKRVAVSLAFPAPVSWKRGIDPSCRLIIDYKKWFDGVNLADPDLSIFDQIMGNLPGSFLLKG